MKFIAVHKPLSSIGEKKSNMAISHSYSIIDTFDKAAGILNSKTDLNAADVGTFRLASAALTDR